MMNIFPRLARDYIEFNQLLADEYNLQFDKRAAQLILNAVAIFIDNSSVVQLLEYLASSRCISS